MTSFFDRRSVLALGTAALAGGARARPAPPPAATADLSGTWTNAWYTHLERPKALKTLVVTQAEAEAYEKPRRALKGELVDNEHDKVGQAESEFPDNGPGLARIHGQIRSSWIVDPADGKIPWTQAGRDRCKAAEPENYDNVEVRPTDERCLTTPGTFAPLINSHDGNVLMFVQAPGWLLIAGEKNHDMRIVRIGTLAPGEPPPAPGSWNGVSVGRWKGRALLVETTGLRRGLTKLDDNLFLSDRTRVSERFERTGPGEIAYAFQVEDPDLFTRAWRGEMVFRASEGRMFEYACHEGNYSLPSILAAARQRDMASR